jgi:hypothetical protein
MLAYELFLKNKDWNEEFVNPTNVKKVYVKATAPALSITINFDDKTLQEYGDNKDSKELLKNLLQMPRNTLKAVGLPFRGTGANSPRAYVEFYGVLKKNTLAISVRVDMELARLFGNSSSTSKKNLKTTALIQT